MNISRRGFVAGLACAFAGPVWAAEFQVITAKVGALQLLEAGSATTPAWRFDSPVIKARQGEELKLRIVNELAIEIWLHFFGVRGPSDAMTVNVPQGASADCVFTPPDAGTFWLGPMANTSKLRDMGLYAMLMVQEREALADIVDQPVIIDDWKLYDTGAAQDDFGDVGAMMEGGRLGNWFTVNGAYRPSIALSSRLFTRLRLLNVANVRNFGVLFKGADPLLIALDGQPLRPRPLGRDALVLAPGQRADFLVAPDQDMALTIDLFEEVSEIAYLVRADQTATPELADNFTLPANPVTAVPGVMTARLVPVVLDGGIKGTLRSALYRGEALDMRALLEKGVGWAINGVTGPGGPPLVQAKLGEIIAFEIENRTGFNLPLHLHGHVWRTETSENWSDTAVIPARQKLKLIMVADNPGDWAINSLAAEWADGGLVAGFTVSP